MRILTQLIRRPAAAQVVEGVVNDVMRSGYRHPYAVRIVTGAVHRAQRRGWGPQFVGRRIAGQTIRQTGGMGDATLDEITSKGQEIQNRHQAILNKLAPGQTALELQPIKNDLEGLRTEWTDWGLTIVGVQYPYELNKTNPAHAVVAAVRDDIGQTINLIDLNRSAEAMARQVQRVKALSYGPILPNLPDIPRADWWKILAVPLGVLAGGFVIFQFFKK